MKETETQNAYKSSHTLKAVLKRWVLVRGLNVDKFGQFRMCNGSAFQRVGAATEKALSPQVRCLVSGGRERRWAPEDRRSREGV